MNLDILPGEARALLTQGNIIKPEAALSDKIAPLLLKLWNNEPLTRGEMAEEITPAELAALWSIKYRTPIKTEYVRQVKRADRIKPSREWGSGAAYRCLYRVRDTIHIEVGHQRGRPRKDVVENAA